MIYDDLETALANNPKKKGVGLYMVCSRYIWTRSKRDALGQWAEDDGYLAHKYHAGAEVDNEIEAPSIQEEMF